MSPIKNTASTDRVEGFVFAFSASGQDVYLPEAMFHGPGIVLSAVGARCGKTFKADGKWAVTANTHVFFVADGNYRDYWWYVTNNEEWWERDGAAQPFVRVKATLDRFWLVPPYEEQVGIAEFLDSADQMLRGGVSQKQRLAELMEEYKRAVIQQAVTRGLDPDVPLKPSGVEWIGDIPEHWEVRRLKDWVSVNETVLPETTDSNYRFNYIDIGSVATGKLLSDPVILNFSDAPSRARRVIKTGDTIFSTVRTYLKAVWFAEFVNSELICSTGFAVLTPQKDAVGKFVSYLVQSSSFTGMITSESVGIAYPAIAEGNLGSFYVPVPPVEEQTAIVAHLDKLTSDIDAAIAHTRREIELLEEYRTRLIADVVTGKLDVREAAVNLPDVSPDDLQPLAEGDEAED